MPLPHRFPLTPALLARGQAAHLASLFEKDSFSSVLLSSALLLAIGAGAYGATVGYWRGGEMALFIAIKTPALFFLTLLITGTLNAVLGLVLGSGISLRQSLQCQLLNFALAATLLGSLAPITFFLAHEFAQSDHTISGRSHSIYLLTHTTLIGFVGIISVFRLSALLSVLCPDKRSARLTLFSWLASNAFVGAQFSYILRPFFGSPQLPVEFLREDPLNGTFYEAVWHSLTSIFTLTELGWLLILAAAAILFFKLLKNSNHSTNEPNS